MKRLKPAGGCIRGLMSLKQIGMVCFAFLFSIFSTNLFATGIDANASSASCDNSTLNTYSGTSNLQANWDANNISVGYYSNGQLYSTSSCDYDDGLPVPTTAPTKTGYTFNGWTIKGLPSGYTRLQYIQTSGTQYINTGIVGAATWKIIAQSNAVSTSKNTILVANGTSGSSWFGALMNGKWGAGTASGYFSSVPNETKVSVEVNFASNKISGNVNGSSFTRSQTNSYMSNAYNLFQFGSDYYFKGKLWNAVCIQSGNLVRDFIPAKNSSNVVGLYDMVSGTFFTNAGSGTFTAGPAVQ